jgi:hypothetical protein
MGRDIQLPDGDEDNEVPSYMTHPVRTFFQTLAKIPLITTRDSFFAFYDTMRAVGRNISGLDYRDN